MKSNESVSLASQLHKNRRTSSTAEWPYCPFTVLSLSLSILWWKTLQRLKIHSMKVEVEWILIVHFKTNRFHFCTRVHCNRSPMTFVLRTSSLIYCSTNSRKNEIYLFYAIKKLNQTRKDFLLQYITPSAASTLPA